MTIIHVFPGLRTKISFLVTNDESLSYPTLAASGKISLSLEMLVITVDNRLNEMRCRKEYIVLTFVSGGFNSMEE